MLALFGLPWIIELGLVAACVLFVVMCVYVVLWIVRLLSRH